MQQPGRPLHLEPEVDREGARGGVRHGLQQDLRLVGARAAHGVAEERVRDRAGVDGRSGVRRHRVGRQGAAQREEGPAGCMRGS